MDRTERNKLPENIAVIERYLRDQLSAHVAHQPYGTDSFDEMFTVEGNPPLQLIATQDLLMLPGAAEKVFAGALLAEALKQCAEEGKALRVHVTGGTECVDPSDPSIGRPMTAYKP